LQTAKETGLKAGIKYVFAGNVPSEMDMNTYCPRSVEMLIGGMNFGIIRSKIDNGQCPKCGTKISGIEL